VTADEFMAAHKRLFVALEAYGFAQTWSPTGTLKCFLAFCDAGTPCWIYVDTSESNSSGYPRGCRFAVIHRRRPAYYIKHESSVLAALARIAKGGGTP
jgi:hypothetical protein